ncbi:MAG: LysR substrate-binding domain-containing protein [Candidatus Gastranaerophilaceae bacterium]
MEIRVLKYFLAVAQEGSITGAANFLHLTQPTLTRQLKDLEKELGHQLFIRTNHNVSLTSEGIVFRKRAQEIIDMVEKTEVEFNSMKSDISGDIYIGAGETVAITGIAKIIKELQEEHKNIKFHLYSGNAEDITERLDKGLLDFGILIQPTDISKYEYVTLPNKDTWGVLMQKNSPLANKKSITKEDLLNVPLIVSKQVMQRKNVKNDYNMWFGSYMERLNIVATYNLIYNAAKMTEVGVGYSIGLENLINTTGESNLCFRPLNPKLESGLDIVWKKHQVFSQAAKLFLSKICTT